MTHSYFKVIIRDNSNYAQEQRRSKPLVPWLNSSKPLAKGTLLHVEGGGEGRGGRTGRRRVEKGTVQGLALGQRLRAGCRGLSSCRKLSSGSTGSGWFLDMGRGSLASAAHTSPSLSSFPSFLPASVPSSSHCFHVALSHAQTVMHLTTSPSLSPNSSLLLHTPTRPVTPCPVTLYPYSLLCHLPSGVLDPRVHPSPFHMPTLVLTHAAVPTCLLFHCLLFFPVCQ